jgi:hypothetical protein
MLIPCPEASVCAHNTFRQTWRCCGQRAVVEGVDRGLLKTAVQRTVWNIFQLGAVWPRGAEGFCLQQSARKEDEPSSFQSPLSPGPHHTKTWLELELGENRGREEDRGGGGEEEMWLGGRITDLVKKDLMGFLSLFLSLSLSLSADWSPPSGLRSALGSSASNRPGLESSDSEVPNSSALTSEMTFNVALCRPLNLERARQKSIP